MKTLGIPKNSLIADVAGTLIGDSWQFSKIDGRTHKTKSWLDRLSLIHPHRIRTATPCNLTLDALPNDLSGFLSL